MIKENKQNNSLAALNAVLVIARAMAHEGCPMEQLIVVLDVAEYLPRLIAAPEDKTDEFREVLFDLVNLDERFGFALERFDSQDVGRW